MTVVCMEFCVANSKVEIRVCDELILSQRSTGEGNQLLVCFQTNWLFLWMYT